MLLLCTSLQYFHLLAINTESFIVVNEEGRPYSSIVRVIWCRQLCAYRTVSSVLFLEPASSTKPQFPSVNDVGLRVTKGMGFTLLCPAQAFPVATYR